jgi:uncharacterized protein YjcR
MPQLPEWLSDQNQLQITLIIRGQNQMTDEDIAEQAMVRADKRAREAAEKVARKLAEEIGREAALKAAEETYKNTYNEMFRETYYKVIEDYYRGELGRVLINRPAMSAFGQTGH